MARQFSQKKKNVAGMFTDLEGDADHKIPFAKGGSDDVTNCQISPPETNKKKGTFMLDPWGWQDRCEDAWAIRERGKPFLISAPPSSGKTWACLKFVRKWLDGAPNRRYVTVVPSIPLRDQWENESNYFNIPLQLADFGVAFKPDYLGGVTTFQALLGDDALMMRKYCSIYDVLVCVDEVHHCGEENRFGECLCHAFEEAVERVILTGTPWRTKKDRIPWMKYNDAGYPVPDFIYTLSEAIDDGNVLSAIFHGESGEIINNNTGEKSIIDRNIDENQAQGVLHKLLTADDNYCRIIIKLAHNKLIELRKTTPDAAAIAVCCDQTHAVRMARIIHEITGRKPSIIVSDSGLENDNIIDFAKDTTEWLVTVRKVSEGANIKRLQVLAYLTNTITPLFFRQVIGRVTRVRGEDLDPAYVYMPSHPNLVANAMEMLNDQIVGIEESGEHLGDEFETDTDGSEKDTFEPDTYSTNHIQHDISVIHGEAMQARRAKLIEHLLNKTDYRIEIISDLVKYVPEEHLPTTHSKEEITSKPTESIHTLEKKLKNSCAKAVNYYVYARDELGDPISHQDAHNLFNDGKSHKTMSIQELKDKYSRVIKACKPLKISVKQLHKDKQSELKSQTGNKNGKNDSAK